MKKSSLIQAPGYSNYAELNYVYFMKMWHLRRGIVRHIFQVATCCQGARGDKLLFLIADWHHNHLADVTLI